MNDQPTQRTIASLKAELAAMGAELHPEAVLHTRSRPAPGVTGTLLALERVADVNGKPDYCIHGFASCVRCEELCYLGSETSQYVLEGKAYPVCLPCARILVPEPPPVAAPRLNDNRRTDGPHEH